MRKVKKIVKASVALSALLLIGSSMTVDAASDYTLVITRSDVSMKWSPSYTSGERETIKKGKLVRNYGIDFVDGDADFDHVYCYASKHYGYVNHHDW